MALRERARAARASLTPRAWESRASCEWRGVCVLWLLFVLCVVSECIRDEPSAQPSSPVAALLAFFMCATAASRYVCRVTCLFVCCVRGPLSSVCRLSCHACVRVAFSGSCPRAAPAARRDGEDATSVHSV
jgi:hypothetical protein